MSDADVTDARGAGFYGKLPSRGDFVKRNLPRAFVTPLDDWLQHALLASREALQENWLNCYLHCPIWHFVVPGGVFGESGWCGTMMPSVDRVNRYFPLVIAAPIGEACSGFAVKDRNDVFFRENERLLMLALEDDDLDLDDFTAKVTSLQPLEEVAGLEDATAQKLAGGGMRVSAYAASLNHTLLDELCRTLCNPYSIWWTDEADGRERLMLLNGLPRHEDYVDLITVGVDTVDEVDTFASGAGDLDSDPLV